MSDISQPETSAEVEPVDILNDVEAANEAIVLEDDDAFEQVILAGQTQDQLLEAFSGHAVTMSSETLRDRIRSVGTWQNIVFRAIQGDADDFEIMRIQQAMKDVADEGGDLGSHQLIKDGKILLQTSHRTMAKSAPGTVRELSGREAKAAMGTNRSGKAGWYRILLYNSGITVDVVLPSPSDIQTMINNCAREDDDLGTTQGMHYYLYSDQVFKINVVRFLQQLIIRSSFKDWNKNGQLWNVIKLPDLQALVMTIAAICYKDGYDNFIVPCTRIADPNSEDPIARTPCERVETLTVDLFKMILTRHSAMSEESVNHMVAARSSAVSNQTLVELAQYQSGLGFDGEKITIGDVVLTMRVPSVTEHLDSGQAFLSAIRNEIDGDNTAGRYQAMGMRYIRTLTPWIASLDIVHDDGSIDRTADPEVIGWKLEQVDHSLPDSELREKIQAYINKIQLTYVGYPATPCTACGHMPQTPSGLLTFDPFSAFFTLAVLYTNPTVSTLKKN